MSHGNCTVHRAQWILWTKLESLCKTIDDGLIDREKWMEMRPRRVSNDRLESRTMVRPEGKGATVLSLSCGGERSSI